MNLRESEQFMERFGGEKGKEEIKLQFKKKEKEKNLPKIDNRLEC